MQSFMSLEWISIGASVAAFLSLVGSVFSAFGAAKSADVARSAEKRMVATERGAAIRELIRTSAKVALEARLGLLALENASRAAIANAGCYSTVDRKMPYLKENSLFQAKIEWIKDLANHGVDVATVADQTDAWIEKRQLELDKLVFELSGERAYAEMREEQLTYVNRQIVDDVTASERAKGIYVQQDHNGKLV